MEVVIPVPPTDFHFDSTCSSPYISAPSSPKRFGDLNYFSAPTSPTRSATIYTDFNNSPLIPFGWEEKPGTPKPTETEDDDFAFDFSGQLDKAASLTADELFEKGKIRPLKPPPRLQIETPPNSNSSPKSPRKKFFSPRHKSVDFDPFAAAIEETRKGGAERERGRERISISASKSGRRGARSLSPFRVSDFGWEQQELQKQQQHENPLKPSSLNSKTTSSSSSGSGSKTHKIWRLKDFLLFRSASEGSTKHLLKKSEDVKNSSFRSTDSGGSVSGSRSSRRGPVSAHELHYTANRAVSAELRKKTFLPYRQGLLGCLGFNPTVHGLAKGFDSITRG